MDEERPEGAVPIEGGFSVSINTFTATVSPGCEMSVVC